MSISSILKNYEVLQSALDEIKSGNDEYAAKGSGLLLSMEKFDTFFGLKLSYLIFSAAEQLSINLQAKDATVQEALHGADLLYSHLNSLRTEEKFNMFYDQVLQESATFTDEPTLPRTRKPPRRIDDGASPHVYRSPRDMHRHAYFEAIELAANEVKRRFDQADFAIIFYYRQPMVLSLQCYLMI